MRLKGLGCHAGHNEVSFDTPEGILRNLLSTSEGAYFGFETQGSGYKKFKTGASVARKND